MSRCDTITPTNIVAPRDAETSRGCTSVWRCTVNTVPHTTSHIKPQRPYVYTLAYPESMGGTVFYVGKGTYNHRITEHEAEAKGKRKESNSYKCRVIRKILARGEQTIKTILAYLDTEQDAHMYEIALIFFMRPYNNLTNLTDGGDGVSGLIHTETSRNKISHEPLAEAEGLVPTFTRISDYSRGATG